jgi:RNA polymerase sigma factor (sigma-70 family)
MSSEPRSAQIPTDDRTLAARVVSGDRAAFESIIRRYNRRLYRLARAALRDDADAKDALQDAYLHAYRSIAQYRGDASLSTWLSRVVLNQCSARTRRASRRDNIVPIVSAGDRLQSLAEVTEPPESPDGLTAREQIRSVLEKKVSELPEIFRLVFVLRSIEELSVEETADTLGISAETVRSRHFRAKGMLRESLAREVDLAHGDIFEFAGEACDQLTEAVLARLAITLQRC